MPSLLGDDNGAGYGVKGQSPNIGVVGESPAGVGVAAKSTTGKAFIAEAQSGPAVSAFSDSGPAVEALTNSGTTIDARSVTGIAVSGESEANAGVSGRSKSWAGVLASSETRAGVSAFSDSGPAVEALTNTGAGVSARSVQGVGVSSVSDEAIAIKADSQHSHAISATTGDENSAGIIATNSSSAAGTGVIGKVQGNNAIGVLGDHTGQWDLGTGVLGRSETAIGVMGIGHRIGVEGRSRGGVGVLGRMEESEDGSPYFGDGVVGETFSGNGVRGHSENGDGVNGDSSNGTGVRAETSSETAAALVAIQRNPDSAGAAIYAEHRGGRDAGYFQGNVKITGHIEFVGADCAEEFEVARDVEPNAVKPGTVVIIGDDNALAPSDRPCDSRVAGVIAGAGNLLPALVLGALPAAPNERPRIKVALSGRVYCKVDAAYGAISPGDLLTTSPTPGHAMRVAPEDAHPGTVLGKAMRPHPRDVGLIPILVGLH